MLPIIIQVIVFLSRMFQRIKLKFENLIQCYYFFQKNVANIAKSQARIIMCRPSLIQEKEFKN